MRESHFPTHEEVRGLLEKLDEICREAERICVEVEEGSRRTPRQSAAPQRRVDSEADIRSRRP
jgi:hypothetical protein